MADAELRQRLHEILTKAATGLGVLAEVILDLNEIIPNLQGYQKGLAQEAFAGIDEAYENTSQAVGRLQLFNLIANRKPPDIVVARGNLEVKEPNE